MEHKRVTRVLRHRATGEFYKDDGWTKNPEEAKRFADVLDAGKTCAERDLIDVELVLRAEPRSSDMFCTPLR